MERSHRDDDEDGNGHVHARAQPDRPAEPQVGDEVEPGEGAAHHRPQRVDGVQVPDAPTQRRELGHAEPAEHRQRGAHERRGDDDHDKRQEKQDDAEGGEGDLHQAVQVSVRALRDGEERGDQETVESHPRLQEAVRQQRIAAGIHQAAEDIAAQGQSRHERRQDRGDGVGGVPEDLGQQPGPDHLVEKAGRAGEEEEEIDEGQQAAGERGGDQGFSFLPDDAGGFRGARDRI